MAAMLDGLMGTRRKKSTTTGFIKSKLYAVYKVLKKNHTINITLMLYRNIVSAIYLKLLHISMKPESAGYSQCTWASFFAMFFKILRPFRTMTLHGVQKMNARMDIRI